MITKCTFRLAWLGECGTEIVRGANRCLEHSDIVCVSCGSKATHECEQTGQLICGAPLCDNCTHNIHPEGHNGGVRLNTLEFPNGMKTHCKKSELEYAPWFVNEMTLSEWKKANGIPDSTLIKLTNTVE